MELQDLMKVFGGRSALLAHNDLWSYDPATDQWIQIAPTSQISQGQGGSPVPGARSFHVAGPEGNRFFVFGGEGLSSNICLKDTWKFDTEGQSWEQEEDMPEELPRSAGALFFSTSKTAPVTKLQTSPQSDQVLIFGGLIANTPSNRSFVFSPDADPSSIAFFPLIGDGVAGDIGFQTSLIFVNTGAAADLQIEFLDANGDPMPMLIEEPSIGPTQIAPISIFNAALAGGQSLALQTTQSGDPTSGALLVGYARIITSEKVGGTAVFTRSDAPTETVLYAAGVPAAGTLTEFSLFLDSLDNRDTGLALVNPTANGNGTSAQEGEATVTLRLYNTAFELLATTEETLADGAQFSRFILEFFRGLPAVSEQAQEMQGWSP